LAGRNLGRIEEEHHVFPEGHQGKATRDGDA
jgi:hypothetical protein